MSNKDLTGLNKNLFQNLIFEMTPPGAGISAMAGNQNSLIPAQVLCLLQWKQMNQGAFASVRQLGCYKKWKKVNF